MLPVSDNMNQRLLRAFVSTVVFAFGFSLSSGPGALCANDEGAGSAAGGRKNATPAQSRTKYGDKWAVVVGLDSYSDPALNTVLRLDESAKKLSEALASKGFARDHIRLMLNRDANRQAIMSSLSSGWLGKLSRKNDLAVVFIATQVFPAADGKVYLFPYDTRLANFFGSAIAVEDILSALKSKVNAKDIVLVFQTSFSGTPEMMAGCKTMFGRYNVSVHQNELPEHFTVICSSKSGQPTWGTYFGDNLAEDITLSSKEDSLYDLFAKVRSDTVNDTARDCAGCKVQTPIMLSRRHPGAIALGAPPHDAVSNLPEEIALYLKGQAVYSSTQALFDEYRASRARQAGLSSSTVPFRQLETSTSTSSLSEGFRTRVDDTIVMVKDYLKENPQFGPAHYLIGRLLQFKDDHEGALAGYREAARLCPEQASYHAWAARAQERLGQDSDREWQLAYKLNSKSLSAIDRLATRSLDRGDLDRAGELFDQALALYPGDPTLHIRLSDVLKRQGKLKLAIAQAQEAVFLDEQSVEALVNLGNLLMANNDEKAAHAAYREALELDSKETEFYFVLARGLEKTNDTEGAIRAWTRFVDGSSRDDKRLDDAKKRLDELKKATQ